jgi:hypothetical protein
MMRKRTASPSSSGDIKWDIVDDLGTVVQDRTAGPKSKPSVWIVTSAATVLLFFGTVAGSPTQIARVANPVGAGSWGSAYSGTSPATDFRSRKSRDSAEGPDTQVGMSAGRLAALLPVHFEPAAAEAEYSTEYSFF